MILRAGIDVGGTNLRIGVVDGTQIVDQHRIHADFAQLCHMHAAHESWTHIIDAIATPLHHILVRYPEVASIGIGFPGFINPASGFVLQSPNLPGLHHVDLAGDLAKAIGRPVIVENDAVAAAYGEYRLLGDDSGSLAYIGLGTGVGGGLIHSGRPYTGRHGAAMEVGHIIVDHSEAARPCGCGNRGCLEQYASASGVSVSYRLATGFDLDSLKVAQLAREGDPRALSAFDLAGTSLAQAIAHIAKILDISQVIIGGGLSNSWALMQTSFDTQLQADLIPVLRSNLTVSLSASGDEAGIIGAALLSSSR